MKKWLLVVVILTLLIASVVVPTTSLYTKTETSVIAHNFEAVVVQPEDEIFAIEVLKALYDQTSVTNILTYDFLKDRFTNVERLDENGNYVWTFKKSGSGYINSNFPYFKGAKSGNVYVTTNTPADYFRSRSNTSLDSTGANFGKPLTRFLMDEGFVTDANCSWRIWKGASSSVYTVSFTNADIKTLFDNGQTVISDELTYMYDSRESGYYKWKRAYGVPLTENDAGSGNIVIYMEVESSSIVWEYFDPETGNTIDPETGAVITPTP